MANNPAGIPSRPSGINHMASDTQSSLLRALPNELLILILTHLPIKILLHVAPVCHLLRDLTTRIIHTRLLQALSPKDYRLRLRCHHPAADYRKSNEFFDYIGTPSVGNAGHATPSPNSEDAAECGMGSLYSRFGPTQQDKRNCDVGRTISLDGHELFSQLCTSLTLIKVVQCGSVYVQMKRTMRVWRDWLAQCALKSIDFTQDGSSMEGCRITGHEHSLLSSKLDRTIWTDQSQNVGLRVRVHCRESSLEGRHGPLQNVDEDEPISYDLAIEELMIRSTLLLDSLERLSIFKKDWTILAIVIGSPSAQNTN